MGPVEGSYVLQFRLWLALKIMPRRCLRLYARSLAQLSYDDKWHCYWDDNHWTESVIRKEIRQREVYNVLGPPFPPHYGGP